ncbi:YebC/PmpR family DNA-binding transcriptional regulator [Paucibacter sp. O1-1]|nr:YebC/PmpR family DNA-binding transcriptional regulator [Paucibacter sp. O1-1]MDA3824399.1 YebC/PmpR family DNA-binding transcriptional regulator [Paucibacter sp. O1-1]
MISVFAPVSEFNNIRTALTDEFPEMEFEAESLSFVPQTMTTISGEDIETFDKFIAALEDRDDVQNIYHNAEIDEE